MDTVNKCKQCDEYSVRTIREDVQTGLMVNPSTIFGTQPSIDYEIEWCNKYQCPINNNEKCPCETNGNCIEGSEKRMFRDIFSFEGRIRRTELWISCIINGFVNVILQILLNGSEPQGLIVIIGLAILFVNSWFILSQGAKRCHDLGHSGWWQLIPFYGFWMLFQDSALGMNQYGDNPKGE